MHTDTKCVQNNCVGKMEKEMSLGAVYNFDIAHTSTLYHNYVIAHQVKHIEYVVVTIQWVKILS